MDTIATTADESGIGFRPSGLRGELQTTERAFRRMAEAKCPVDADRLARVLDTVDALLTYPDARIRLGAARVILMAKGLNVRIDANEAKRDGPPAVLHVHQHIDQYAAAFGLPAGNLPVEAQITSTAEIADTPAVQDPPAPHVDDGSRRPRVPRKRKR
jgi:hypothetical protein